MPSNTPLPMIAGIAVLVVGYLLTDWSTTQSSLFATVHTLFWALYTRYELRVHCFTQHAPQCHTLRPLVKRPHAVHYHTHTTMRVVVCVQRLTLAPVAFVGANPLRSLSLSLPSRTIAAMVCNNQWREGLSGWRETRTTPTHPIQRTAQ